MANRILVYDGGKNIGIAGTAEGQLPTWDAASSSWQAALPPVFAGEYFVSTNGSNTTGNGSLSQPFATIQKAVDAAKLAYADGVPVAINVAAGSYADALTIDRYNTFIRGAGARPEENRATQITVAVTINCTSAADVFGRQVGIDGCYISSNADAPAISVTGTGYFSVIVTDSYLTTGNAGSSANAFACSNANARTVVTDSICSVQNSAASAVVLNFTAGTHLWSNTRVQHGSSVTATATSKMLLVGGTASMFADRLLMEPRTNGYQIDVTGTWTSTTTAKLILSNSSLANAAAGGLGLTTDISPAAGALAVLLYDNAFTVASGNVVYSAVASIVLYCDLTFFGASSTLSGITGVPLTNRTGALQVDSLTLPNGTASRFLYTNSSKVATALGSGTKALAGYNESGAPDVITLGTGLSMTGSVLSATGGGGGGSGTVTEVATGTGLTGGPITTSGTISLAALDPAPTGSYGSATAVPAITVDTYGRVTGVVSTSIELAASAITSGTLSIARGGTGTSTAPTAKGVIYADSTSAYGSTAAGTTGTVLRGVTDGAPAFGAVNLGTDVTGTLPAEKQAAQSVGGDLSGSTASATVTKIQGKAVSTSAPTAGEVLAWNGSEYVPVPMPAGGSGGGGVIYFLNQASAGSGTNLPANTYVLGRTAQAAYSSRTASSISTGGWDRVAGFVTDAGDPNISTLPVGLWDFNLWATTAAALGNVRARFILYAYDNATDPESGVAIATSGEMELFDQGGSAQYATSLVVPSGVSLSGNQRLYLKLEVRASISGQSVEFGFGDATPSHTHTTVPSVTGTGVVKVLNGVIVATGQQVSLTSEVSGALPVLNGGTGATTAGDARTNLSAAQSGANSDITSLSGLTTALSVAQGGTGTATTSANQVFAGPSSGGSAAPGFRALVTADLPALPYDVSGEAAGTPDVSTVIFHFKAVRAWTLKGTGSVAGCEVSPTGANVSYTIKKGASSIGTIDFTTGGTNTVTITGGSDVAFSIGEVLTVTTPSDLKTMEAPFFTFLGTCP